MLQGTSLDLYWTISPLWSGMRQRTNVLRSTFPSVGHSTLSQQSASCIGYTVWSVRIHKFIPSWLLRALLTAGSYLIRDLARTLAPSLTGSFHMRCRYLRTFSAATYYYSCLTPRIYSASLSIFNSSLIFTSWMSDASEGEISSQTIGVFPVSPRSPCFSAALPSSPKDSDSSLAGIQVLMLSRENSFSSIVVFFKRTSFLVWKFLHYRENWHFKCKNLTARGQRIWSHWRVWRNFSLLKSGKDVCI